MQRNTRQREVIREVFASAGRPLTPQEAAAAAQDALPSLGVATVYRAVKELADEGWLVALTVAGTMRFELASKGHDHHHHFHCHRCDRTFDIEACAGDLSRLVPSGFVMESHELTLNGACSACVQKTRSGGRRAR
ncbi:MAG: transcriptional repressor [Deltaproteobacteria bacterium]|nr:transcriptional repressor [Deltaproteobacteria bacterium]